jgi:hypothetical protein
MRRCLLIALPFLASLALTAGSAQAVVVADGGHRFGVTMVPGSPLPAGVSSVTTSGGCADPWLSPALRFPSLLAGGLCWHGGASTNRNAVLHRTETFALTWDPLRHYWAGTRGYIEQFLRDVADSSGSTGSPFAVTTQYRDAAGEAQRKSLYGGGCIDYGALGGDFTCQFPHAVVSGQGQGYPSAVGCPLAGSGSACLTDDAIQSEVTRMVGQMGLSGRIQPGYQPLLVVLIPSGVQVCLDSLGALCSASHASPDGFCSYHSSVHVGTRTYAYVVQPWSFGTKCDEANLPEPVPVAVDAGRHIVSPLSESEISAITDPWLNGWYANDGQEMADNHVSQNSQATCRPRGFPVDKVTVGKSSQNPYVLAPEFNNAGVLEFDPHAPACALGVTLAPAFVVPSPIDQGEVVGFDGSATASSLMVATSYPWTKAHGYAWSFGDGTTDSGPSVIHSFAKSGFYHVKLTVTDRGDNVRSLAQTVEVMGPNGQPPSSGGNPGGGQPSGGGGNTKLKVSLQLLPQSLRAVLRNGLAVRVGANEAANGFATLSIFRSAAHRAHLSAAGNPNSLVVIGRGTVSGIKDGTVSLRVRVSSATAKKLAHAGRLTLTLHMTLVAKSGARTTARAVGRY